MTTFLLLPPNCRVQFFKLTDIFLSSGLVPAYTAAAFVKRFTRLALRAPAAGAMIAIAFIHNLVRRHPSCMVLLHKPQKGLQLQQNAQQPAAPASDPKKSHAEPNGDTIIDSKPAPHAHSNGDVAQATGEDNATAQLHHGSQATAHNAVSATHATSSAIAVISSSVGFDVYDESEPDPAASRAVESSLWEIQALRHHYCPQVRVWLESSTGGATPGGLYMGDNTTTENN